MERYQFVQKYPELAKEQNRKWNIWIARLVGIVSLWVGSIVATNEYFTNPEFQEKVDDISEKVIQVLYWDTMNRYL